jgi:hypothetical protein
VVDRQYLIEGFVVRGGLTHSVSNSEDVDGDCHPSTDAVVSVDAIGGVKHVHKKHAIEDQNAAVQSGGAAAPFVDEHESYDSRNADEDYRYAGCEECGFR